MALLREEVFKFTWHFDNFSMSPQQFGKGINSPIFVVDRMKRTKWRLCLYPRGAQKKNCIACFLERIGGSDFVGDITTGVHFRIISGHSNKNIGQGFGSCTFKINDSWGCDDLCIRDDIFDSTHGLLPNDTLTIECQLRRFIQEPKNGAMLSGSTARFRSKNNSKTNQYSALTRIKVRSKSVLWPISKFYLLRPNESLSKTVASAMEGEPSFNMTLYMNEESEIIIEIGLIKQITEGVLVRGKIKILGSAYSQHQGEAEYHFKGEENEIWRFPTFIKRTALIEDGYLQCTKDSLHLYCEFFYSVEGQEYSVEHFNSKQYANASNNCLFPRRVYRQLYADGTFSDVTIRVGTRRFKVHKSILSAKSSVFKTMFESDVREETDIVDIVDFDPDVMDRLLMFIYTDILEHLSQEDVAKLYAAAEEYNVVPLKYRCYAVS